MQPIKLSKKESKEITEKLKNARIPIKRDIKQIKFHKSFDKGWQLALCKECGYPSIFMGIPMFSCCKKQKIKVYPLNFKSLGKFIYDLQSILVRK